MRFRHSPVSECVAAEYHPETGFGDINACRASDVGDAPEVTPASDDPTPFHPRDAFFTHYSRWIAGRFRTSNMPLITPGRRESVARNQTVISDTYQTREG